ncbi:HECT-domain-containing protein [Amylostereum chailletii]|nr:HECT-domain-containing protein [Amylostereum chailletii]
MLPLFANERRKKINLGGASSIQTSSAIRDQAKARRSERQDLLKREESAIRVQAWWRGVREARVVRRHLLHIFEQDVLSLRGLRCLVLIGRNEAVLGRWSAAAASSGAEAFLRPATGPERASWLVLVRQAAHLLLQSVADFPRSPNAPSHIKTLAFLLSSTTTTRVLGPPGSDLTLDVTDYLITRGFYRFMARSISDSPVQCKESDFLLLAIPLLALPLRTYSRTRPDSYAIVLQQLVFHILSIPILPNRIPLKSLTHLAANIPFASLPALSPFIPSIVSSLSVESRIHLTANLLAFAPPRYPIFSPPSLVILLHLYACIMDALPVRAFNPPDRNPSSKAPVDDDTDSESDSPIVVTVLPAVPSPPPLPSLDERTLKRLQTMVAPSHIKSLVSVTHHHGSVQPALFKFILALCTIWPSQATSVLTTVTTSTRAGFMREMYRVYVRSSPLGRDDDLEAILDPDHAPHWPPLIVLSDLYTQALLTMGDDEFFSAESGAGAATASRNPLSLDEVVSFSRKLLTIAFTLYVREDQTNVQETTVPGTNLRWDAAREKFTKCLLAIHSRDSRRPFTPSGHWLMNTHIDMDSFVEAAVVEDQHLTQPQGVRPLSARQVAYLSPRLGILNHIPFSIPFETRVRIFRRFISNDLQYRGFTPEDRWHNKQQAVIRRERIAEDGFDKLGEADLRRPIEITFVDKFGKVESGIDGGGVFKEFLTELCKEVFDRDRGLWLENTKHEIYPNPHSYATEPHSLAWYRFIGRIFGKAMYEGILVNVVFAGFFLAKWLGKQSFLDDLASLDPELYKGLIFLKNNPDDLSINFTVVVEEFGAAKSIDLLPNGSNTPVTRDNRLEYILRMAYYRLTTQIKRQSDAFLEGVSDMIDTKWLRMFNQQELQILLGGVDAPIDIDDWQRNTKYGGLFGDHHPTVLAFWNVVRGLDDEQQRALLRFVSSVGRPPLLGFKELNPPFAIRDAGGDEDRLPTASTCFNLLKMPRYTNPTVLKQKLLQALFSGAGFDLS